MRIPVLVSGLAIALTASGCALLGDGHADLEKSAHAEVAVRDHDRIDTSYAKEAVSIYVGRWVDDPAGLVTVPGGTFRKPEYPLSTDVFDNLTQADFVAGQDKRCHADVFRLRRGKDPQENWPLSAEQRDALRDGALEVLKIVTVCDGKA